MFLREDLIAGNHGCRTGAKSRLDSKDVHTGRGLQNPAGFIEFKPASTWP
jgi:hypothetical protein